ncbi:MAG TPA: PsiF family protein [Casimicrobiaceae bacterium]|jgi:hypothetical protein|nr:PsiF family protein [Casimicrobiaceae bacterium]
MKPLLVLALAGLFACGSAYAADTKADATKTDATKPAATNSQQDKMKDCNAKAGEMKGDDRKAFMKTCLSAKPPAKPKSKMAECNAKAKGLSKEEGDKARSECMKG